MTLEDKHAFRDAFRQAFLLFVIILLCRFTSSGFTLLIGLYGTYAGFTKKVGTAVSCFILYPFLTILNPVIIAGGYNGLVFKIGLFSMALSLLASAGRRRGNFQTPLGTMFVYLAVASLSSVFGYAPAISFSKMANFVGIFVAVWIGFKNLDRRPADLMKIHRAFFAMIVFLILGSCVTILFPAYGYSNDSIAMAMRGFSAEEIAEILSRPTETGMRLFSGVTNQSQCLAVLLPLALTWVICDMMFVERRIAKLHTILILAGLPLIYMTRARIAFVTSAVAVWMIYTYALGRIPVKPKLKRALRGGMFGGLAILAVVGIVCEVRDQSVTKWLRKTDDLEEDERSFEEAFTSSRQGLMEASLADFQSSPVYGKGFQVSWEHQFMGDSFTFAAPIEKGVLPVMILGETGVLGEAAFLVFLGAVVAGCARKRYVVTLTMFLVFLATNLAEATFFSPGGAGGLLWTLSCGGGFVLDTIVLARRREEGKKRNLVPLSKRYW